MVPSIEDGNRDEPTAPRPGWLRPDPLRNLLPNLMVWPSAVEVIDLFLDYMGKIVLVGNPIPTWRG